MTSSAVANTPSQNVEGYSDFLTYLRSKFNNQEASAFSTSFATFLREKVDDYCIDLDKAYTWLGYANKGKAVELIQKVGLHENTDFSLSRPGKRNLPTKYMLKPDSFKKLLLAAQTKESKKAADYFIKIERAIQEFQSEGGMQFSPQPREVKWKTLALEHYTEELKDPVQLTSAGYNNDLSDPQLYLGIPKNVKFPRGVIPEGANVVEFGWTSSSGKRFEAHRKSHGEFLSLDHFPCPDAPGLEHEWIRILEILGIRVYGKRQDGSKNLELFKVLSQQEYESFAARIYEAQQRLINLVCHSQVEREKRLTAEAEVAKEKEKSLQEKEKTKQSEFEAKKVIAETEASVRKSEEETKRYQQQQQEETKRQLQQEETKRFELKLKYANYATPDQSDVEIRTETPTLLAGYAEPPIQALNEIEAEIDQADVPAADPIVRVQDVIETETPEIMAAAPSLPVATDTGAGASNLIIALDRLRKPVLQHNYQTGAFIMRFNSVREVQKRYRCCKKTIRYKIIHQEEFLGSRWNYDTPV